MGRRRRTLQEKLKNKTAREKFNPLALDSIAETMVTELLKMDPIRLDQVIPFEGSGVYAIYYSGSMELYRLIALENRGGKWDCPIYVGKAKAFERLRQHAQSIQEATNLSLEDFWCRFLVTEEIFIPLCENLLIKRFRPIWNEVITGFGPKVVGKERTSQQTSMWDMLHPGRHGRGSAPNRRFRSVADVRKKLEEYFSKK